MSYFQRNSIGSNLLSRKGGEGSGRYPKGSHTITHLPNNPDYYGNTWEVENKDTGYSTRHRTEENAKAEVDELERVKDTSHRYLTSHQGGSGGSAEYHVSLSRDEGDSHTTIGRGLSSTEATALAHSHAKEHKQAKYFVNDKQF